MKIECPKCERLVMLEANVKMLVTESHNKTRVITVNPHATTEHSIAQCQCGFYLTVRNEVR